jgi:ureidoglycolate lyase
MLRKLSPSNERDFAPFGEVFSPPAVNKRTHIAAFFRNLRPHAHIDCYIVHCEAKEPPYATSVMERHSYPSQTLVPVSGSRYIVAAASSTDADGPDLSKLQAFMATKEQGINCHAGTWHCLLAVLDQTAQFLVAIWKDRSQDDEQFVDLPDSIQFTD